jgi:hydroxyacylglutathione hydrolase
VKLTDDLYAFPWEGYENNCNSFFLGGGVGALIDVGHLKFADELIGRMMAEGVSPDDIRLVILTHSHPDHIEAIARFTEMGLKVGMHPAAVEYLNEAGEMIYSFLGSDVPEFEVDVELIEGPVEALDDLVEVYHTPGHEPGSICVYWPERKALATGDLVFAQGVGRTDFPGGSHAELMKQIDRIASLEVEYILPGHGPVIAGETAARQNYEVIRRMFG